MAKLIHTMIRVLDLDKSLAFYRDVLDMKPSHTLDFPDFALVYLRNNEDDAEIVAVDLPAGARVWFAAAGTLQIDGQVLLLEGRLQLSFGAETLSLCPGDCARVAIHLAHELHNPGAEAARYLVVIRQVHLPPRPAPRVR